MRNNAQQNGPLFLSVAFERSNAKDTAGTELTAKVAGYTSNEKR